MATPAAINQVAQYGIESTAGTAVATTHTLPSATVELAPKFETGSVRPSGSRYKTAVYVKKEWCEGSLDGVPCFNFMPVFLEWALGAPVTTGVGPYTHVFTAGDGQTWTFQVGDGTHAGEIPGVMVTDFELGWGRNSGDATFKANLTGMLWDDAATLTASPTTPTVAPVLAAGVSVYCDDSLAEIGTTQIPEMLKVSFKSGKLRAPVWHLDASQESYAATVATSSEDAEVELLVEATATGRAFLASLRAGDIKYLRIEATGATQSMTIDLAVQANDHSRGDEDDVWAVTVPFSVVQDSSGFNIEITVIDATA